MLPESIKFVCHRIVNISKNNVFANYSELTVLKAQRHEDSK